MLADNWTPTSFDQYLGQRHIVEEILDEIIATQEDNLPLSHRILYGEPGLGKSALAHLIAKVRGADLVRVVGKDCTLQRLSTAILELRDDGYASGPKVPPSQRGYVIDRRKIIPSIIFIDEAEGIPRKLLQLLHDLLEGRGADGKPQTFCGINDSGMPTRFWVPEVSVYFATNFLGDLYKADQAIFSRCAQPMEFRPYTEDELTQIIIQFAEQTGRLINEDAAIELAARSRNIPRVATQLLKETSITLRTFEVRSGIKTGIITSEIVKSTFAKKGIDDYGLDEVSRRYLHAIALTSVKRKKGLENIACSIGVDVKTAESVIEPYLIRKGFVERGSGGRWITDDGRCVIGQQLMDQASNRRV